MLHGSPCRVCRQQQKMLILLCRCVVVFVILIKRMRTSLSRRRRACVENTLRICAKKLIQFVLFSVSDVYGLVESNETNENRQAYFGALCMLWIWWDLLLRFPLYTFCKLFSTLTTKASSFQIRTIALADLAVSATAVHRSCVRRVDRKIFSPVRSTVNANSVPENGLIVGAITSTLPG